MEFRLTYRGPLKSKSSTTKQETHTLRRHFHNQLSLLWETNLLSPAKPYVDPDVPRSTENIYLLRNVGEFIFAPLVTQDYGWNTVAKLDILFLRPSDPGQLIGHSGNLDNRLKALFDGLRMPSANEIPSGDKPSAGERPFYSLLHDDALVVGFSVVTDRLLTASSRSDVELVIHVTVTPTRRSMGNLFL